jgi:hypothetical protein
MQLITEDLLESVKLRGFIPVSQSTFTNARLLQILNEKLSDEIVPAIMSIRENFFLTYERRALTASQSRYALPERAAGTSIKTVWYVDSSGNRMRVPSRTDARDLREGAIGTGEPEEFMMMGDEIQVFPTPASSSGYLEFWYYRRPSRLALTSSCAKITAVNTAAGVTTFTVDTDLTASLSVGSTVDFLAGKSPFLSWADDVAITAITTTTIAVSASAISSEASAVEPRVNDYICPAGYANFPQIPAEMHPILAQSAAVYAIQSLGDMEKLAAASQTLDRMLKNGFKLIANRVESEPEQVIHRSSISNFI